MNKARNDREMRRMQKQLSQTLMMGADELSMHNLRLINEINQEKNAVAKKLSRYV
jgi:hypothetical protein